MCIYCKLTQTHITSCIHPTKDWQHATIDHRKAHPCILSTYKTNTYNTTRYVTYTVSIGTRGGG